MYAIRSYYVFAQLSAGAQIPASQLPLVQSESPTQSKPSAQFAHTGPPQSMSVSPSSMLFVPSAQVGAQMKLFAREAGATAQVAGGVPAM